MSTGKQSIIIMYNIRGTSYFDRSYSYHLPRYLDDIVMHRDNFNNESIYDILQKPEFMEISRLYHEHKLDDERFQGNYANCPIVDLIGMRMTPQAINIIESYMTKINFINSGNSHLDNILLNNSIIKREMVETANGNTFDINNLLRIRLGLTEDNIMDVAEYVSNVFLKYVLGNDADISMLDEFDEPITVSLFDSMSIDYVESDVINDFDKYASCFLILNYLHGQVNFNIDKISLSLFSKFSRIIYNTDSITETTSYEKYLYVSNEMVYSASMDEDGYFNIAGNKLSEREFRNKYSTIPIGFLNGDYLNRFYDNDYFTDDDEELDENIINEIIRTFETIIKNASILSYSMDMRDYLYMTKNYAKGEL